MGRICQKSISRQPHTSTHPLSTITPIRILHGSLDAVKFTRQQCGPIKGLSWILRQFWDAFCVVSRDMDNVRQWHQDCHDKEYLRNSTGNNSTSSSKGQHERTIGNRCHQPLQALLRCSYSNPGRFARMSESSQQEGQSAICLYRALAPGNGPPSVGLSMIDHCQHQAASLVRPRQNKTKQNKTKPPNRGPM